MKKRRKKAAKNFRKTDLYEKRLIETTGNTKGKMW